MARTSRNTTVVASNNGDSKNWPMPSETELSERGLGNLTLSECVRFVIREELAKTTPPGLLNKIPAMSELKPRIASLYKKYSGEQFEEGEEVEISQSTLYQARNEFSGAKSAPRFTQEEFENMVLGEPGADDLDASLAESVRKLQDRNMSTPQQDAKLAAYEIRNNIGKRLEEHFRKKFVAEQKAAAKASK